MTTPITNKERSYRESTVNNYTTEVVDASICEELEIETQELAEALRKAEDCLVSFSSPFAPPEMGKVLETISKVLARFDERRQFLEQWNN